MPLVVIDWVHSDFSISHGGLLRRYAKESLIYVDGQILEAYEGWLGHEYTRVLNTYVTALITSDKIYLPREEMIRLGIIPKVWITFAVIAAKDASGEYKIPVYPRKVVPYTPYKDLLTYRLEDLMLRMTGLKSKLPGIILRTLGVIEELKAEKSKRKKKEKERKTLIRRRKR